MAKKRKIVEVDLTNTKMDMSKVKNGRLRHTYLSKEQMGRIKDLHREVGKYLYPVLELWERGFMCDQTPDNEIGVWEEIAAAFKKHIKIKKLQNKKLSRLEKMDLVRRLVIKSTKKNPLKIECWEDE